MTQHLSYITLDSIVQDYLNESEQSQAKYFKVWHIAFRGLEDLGLDFFYTIQAVKLPVNANKTVTLPAGYVKWTKVGRLNERGEIIPLWYNDKLTTYADLMPDRISKTQDPSTIGADWNDWGLNTWANYWNGYAYTNIYGVPSGAPFAGDFKVDEVNGVILLNEKYREDYLMLEFMCSPQPGNGQDYYLPIQFREALVSWIRWKDIIAIPVKTRPQQSNVEMRRRDYYNDRRIAIGRWKPVRTYDIYQTSQEMTRQAVKS